MKMFEQQTHYDILGIPFDADWSAVKAAYRHALDIYAENSLATYALFSDEQRADMLQAIEAAYHTLIDPHQRAAYNQMLSAAGRVETVLPPLAFEDAPQPSHEPPPPLKNRDLRVWVGKKAKEEGMQRMIDDAMRQDRISGPDLKRLREAFGIELAEIFEQTRISRAMLEMIEANRFDSLPAEVFLKSFLKSYAQILQIDPQRVIEGYLRQMSLDRPAG
jgi:hypothetical protein